MIRIGPEQCRDFGWSSRREWLVTNGAGGYAMGTVAGVNTRRYHGLLIAALRPPVDRHLLLARLEETADGTSLATVQYPGALAPQGFLRLLEFRLEPGPVWLFDIGGGATLERRVSMPPGEQAVVVQYLASRPVKLDVSPFVAFRDHHALTHANPALDGRVSEDLSLRPYAALPALQLETTPRAGFRADGCWYFGHEYLAELERGLEFREDLWKAGTFSFALEAGQPALFCARTGPRLDKPSATPAALPDGAADPFLVRRADGRPTVIAGYPWFTDWGRDTMISLPGLLLSRRRLAKEAGGRSIGDAREVLRVFLAHLDRGLVPNRFPDSAAVAPEYNTADATLLMFQAVAAWLDAGGEASFLRDEFYPLAKEIIRWHRSGTRHGIRVDPADRLLCAGEPGLALTWMDARFEGTAITPRIGKPVEINAFWVTALELMARWGRELSDEPAASELAIEAQMAGGSFRRAFWNPARGCLFDVVGPNDPAIRPNQLFAVPLISAAQRKLVVQTVEKLLLTPYGLRTLAPGEPGYAPHYRGTMEQRDHAYHQGTVWPWLLVPYVRAYLSAFGRTPQTLQHCRTLLAPLERHLREDACLGSISEVFDAEPPHSPGGAPAQAWSVAALLQLISELEGPA